jgi:DNA-binding transcriptional LysR family regulator
LIYFAVTSTITEVSLSQIRYFVAVAEEGNVGRAAQRLHVAQPPISRHIRALEDEIGAQLFERTPRGMTLLPPGRVFLDHARALLAAIDHAVVAVRAEMDHRVTAGLPPSTRKRDS